MLTFRSFLTKILLCFSFARKNKNTSQTTPNNNYNNDSDKGSDIIEKIYRLCRKNSLINEELVNSLKKIEEKIEVATITTTSSSSSPVNNDQINNDQKNIFNIPLNYFDAINVVDGLNKIITILNSNIDLNKSNNKEAICNILKERIDLICNKSNLSTTSIVGNIYNNNTDIIMSSKSCDQLTAKGTIIDIISQGYIKNGNELLKKAKVIVSI
ncbi:MAG: nucleotide exchange factor GrpE [Oligoflexia bacterium]|nr:nucleotide exchange factor GrpE [Oligoflexia bacterium]